MKKLLIACFALGMLAACSTDDVSKVNEREYKSSATNQNLAFTTILNGEIPFNFNGNHRQQFVVNTAVEWNSFISQIENNNAYIYYVDELSNEVIDFNTEVVVVVIDRLWPTGGNSIDIVDVVEGDSEVEVTVDRLNKAGLIVTFGFTRPIHIVKFAKSNKPIVFNMDKLGIKYKGYLDSYDML